MDISWRYDGDNNCHILLSPVGPLGLNKKADPAITMTKLLDFGVDKRFAVVRDAINVSNKCSRNTHPLCALAIYGLQ